MQVLCWVSAVVRSYCNNYFQGTKFHRTHPIVMIYGMGGTLAGLAGRPQRVGDREICHAQRVGYRVYLVRTGKGIRPQF